MSSEEKDLAAANQATGKSLEVATGNLEDVKDTLALELSEKLSAKETVNPSVKTPRGLPIGWRLGENVQILAIALCLALLIRMFVAEPRYIPSDSMIPTLQLGDRLVVEKISYRFRAPKFGEIVVFDPPEQLLLQGYAKDQAFIKRIIGLPGQVVKVQNGKIYLNNQPLEEHYIAEPPDYQWGPELVPEDQLFVMGDNRNNSNDSHIWGFLPRQNVIGHAFFRFWPTGRIGPV